MLQRRHRLRKSDRPSAILKDAPVAKSRFLVARFQKNTLDHHRFGIVVSQKISRKAVVRNRIRRQIHEIIRLNYEKFPTRQHFEILILPKTSIIDASYADMEKSLLSLLRFLR